MKFVELLSAPKDASSVVRDFYELYMKTVERYDSEKGEIVSEQVPGNEWKLFLLAKLFDHDVGLLGLLNENAEQIMNGHNDVELLSILYMFEFNKTLMDKLSSIEEKLSLSRVVYPVVGGKVATKSSESVSV